MQTPTEGVYTLFMPIFRVYGAKNLSIARNRSGRLSVIIVDDASQNISSSYWNIYAPFWPRHRKVLTYALMWPGMVIIFSILSENAVKVVFIQNQDMVETLFTNRSYPPFSICICSGSSVWSVKDFNPF